MTDSYRSVLYGNPQYRSGRVYEGQLQRPIDRLRDPDQSNDHAIKRRLMYAAAGTAMGGAISLATNQVLSRYMPGMNYNERTASMSRTAGGYAGWLGGSTASYIVGDPVAAAAAASGGTRPLRMQAE